MQETLATLEKMNKATSFDFTETGDTVVDNLHYECDCCVRCTTVLNLPENLSLETKEISVLFGYSMFDRTYGCWILHPQDACSQDCWQ